MPSNAHVRVGLRGLTFSGRVWNEGDEVFLDDLPEILHEAVKAGEHPHLTLVEAEKPASKPDKKASEKGAT